MLLTIRVALILLTTVSFTTTFPLASILSAFLPHEQRGNCSDVNEVHKPGGCEQSCHRIEELCELPRGCKCRNGHERDELRGFCVPKENCSYPLDWKLKHPTVYVQKIGNYYMEKTHFDTLMKTFNMMWRMYKFQQKFTSS